MNPSFLIVQCAWQELLPMRCLASPSYGSGPMLANASELLHIATVSQNLSPLISIVLSKTCKMPPSTPAATITSLDHLVLTVKSITTSKDWYTQYLGMHHEVFVSGVARHALIFGNSKINLHEAGKVSLSLIHVFIAYLCGLFPVIIYLGTRKIIAGSSGL